MKKRFTCIVVFMLLFITVLPVLNINAETDDWWDTNWSYRKLITIDSSLVDEDLTNFPVLISTIDDDLQDDAQYNGNDIAFIDMSGTTLNHEIEKYDGSSGKLVTWVNIPSLSSSVDTTIWMYYGNDDCISQQNPEGVWDSNSVMIQHFEESSGMVYDSSSNDNDGTVEGDTASDAAVKIDSAYVFDGDGDYVNISDSDSFAITDEITFSAWVKLDDNLTYNPILRKGESYLYDVNEDGITNSIDSDIAEANCGTYSQPYPRYDVSGDGDGDGNVGSLDFGLISASYGCGSSSQFWYLQISDLEGAGTAYCYFYLDGTTSPRLRSSQTFNSFHVGRWYHITAVYDGEYSLLYINGELDASQANSGTINVVNAPLYLGADNYRYNLYGSIDEVRISNIARSEEWVNANFDMMNAPDSFLSFGDEEHYGIEPLSQLVINALPSITEGEPFAVTVKANNKPIENVDITFNGNAASTDAEGKVSFTAPMLDTDIDYTISATKDGYTDARTTIRVKDRKLTIAVVPIEVIQGDSFAVIVTEGDTGYTIENADIVFNGQTVPTDSDGKYIFPTESTSPDIYQITASKSGYKDADIKWILVKPKPSDELQPENGWIWGLVYDTSGGIIESAKICARPLDSTTSECTFSDEYGVYISKSLTIGTYLVKASKLGYESSTEMSVVVEDGVATYAEFTLETFGDEQSEDQQLISDAIEAGYIGALVTVTKDAQPSTEYYQDEVYIQDVVYNTDDGFTLTVGAPSGTPSTFIIAQIVDAGFSSGELVVRYDDIVIDQLSLSQFLNPESLSEPGYVLLETSDGVCVAVFVHHFSEHTITIYQVIETISIVVIVTLYVAMCVASIAVFAYPVFSGTIRFRRKKKL